MHAIEPYFAWRNHYIASEDEASPFYNRVYSEFQYTDKIYNYYIHPQWDKFGSPTLFIKILLVDYNDGYTILEFLGEWNDAITNDIMLLKREIIEPLLELGISKFILIGENVLNFHYSDDCYYEEWFEEVEEGWIAMVNFQEHVVREFATIGIDHYFVTGGELEEQEWRTMQPDQFFEKVENYVNKRLS